METGDETEISLGDSFAEDFSLHVITAQIANEDNGSILKF